MYKIILIFAIGVLTQNEILSKTSKTESEELQEWVYWNAFSQTFNETADYWKAESAALKAEDEVRDIVDSDKWLAKTEDIEKSRSKDHKS